MSRCELLYVLVGVLQLAHEHRQCRQLTLDMFRKLLADRYRVSAESFGQRKEPCGNNLTGGRELSPGLDRVIAT
jgi:hypothetical protein